MQTAMMKKVLGVGGSPRKGGNSDIILKCVLKGAGEAGAATEEVQLRDYQFQGCIGCERCRKDEECTGLNDGMQLIYPKIRQAAGLVVICPVYSYNVTALMKAFIDRLYSFYEFSDQRPGHWRSRLADQGRKAIIAAVGEQATGEEGGMDLTLETIRRSILALGYEIVAELPVLGVFQKGRVKERPEVLEKATELGKKLGAALPL
jgi:multimeric flavodoxin WrbA